MTSPFGAQSLYPQMPQVPWIYIHEIVIRKIDVAAGTVDAEGRWRTGQSASEQPCKAFVSPVGEERTPSTGQAPQERVDAIARVPRNTDVAYSDEVDIRGVSFDLDGHYRVSKVGINPVDIRLSLFRIADDPTFDPLQPQVVEGSLDLTSGSG